MVEVHLPGSRRVIAVADIGSASAAVGILALQGKHPALVLAARRSVMPIGERSREASIAGIGGELYKAGTDALKKYTETLHKSMGPVRELYCIVRAPWVGAKVSRVASSFEKSSIITDAMIRELAARALEQGKGGDALLEAAVIRVELNGYPTGNPTGKRARSLELSALVTSCDAQLLATVKDALGKLFPHISPTMRSSSRAVLSALRRDSHAGADYFVVDMTSEGASLIAVREGIIAQQVEVPEGMRSILRRISPTGMPEDTLNMLRILERDECTTDACNALRESLGKAEPELVRVFGEGMSAIAANRRLPNALVLIAHPDIAPWLAKFFSRIDFTQFTQTTQPFTVDVLSPRELSAWVQPGVGVSLDGALALSSALVSREKWGQ